LDGKIEATFTIKRDGKDIHVQKRGPAKAWNVSLANDPATKIKLEGQSRETTIRLP
jgi:hypothetical protein